MRGSKLRTTVTQKRIFTKKRKIRCFWILAFLAVVVFVYEPLRRTHYAQKYPFDPLPKEIFWLNGGFEGQTFNRYQTISRAFVLARKEASDPDAVAVHFGDAWSDWFLRYVDVEFFIEKCGYPFVLYSNSNAPGKQSVVSRYLSHVFPNWSKAHVRRVFYQDGESDAYRSEIRGESAETLAKCIRPPRRAREVAERAFNDLGPNARLLSVHRRYLDGHCKKIIEFGARPSGCVEESPTRECEERWDLWMRTCAISFDVFEELVKRHDQVSSAEPRLRDRTVLFLSSDKQRDDSQYLLQAKYDLVPSTGDFLSDAWLMALSDVHVGNVGSSIDNVLSGWRKKIKNTKTLPESYFDQVVNDFVRSDVD